MMRRWVRIGRIMDHLNPEFKIRLVCKLYRWLISKQVCRNLFAYLESKLQHQNHAEVFAMVFTTRTNGTSSSFNMVSEITNLKPCCNAELRPTIVVQFLSLFSTVQCVSVMHWTCFFIWSNLMVSTVYLSSQPHDVESFSKVSQIKL